LSNYQHYNAYTYRYIPQAANILDNFQRQTNFGRPKGVEKSHFEISEHHTGLVAPNLDLEKEE
jgi:hypothetical protein